MISKRYHLNERICVCHRNTLVFTTNTLIQILADSKNKTLVLFFGYFGSFLLPLIIRLVVNVHFYYKIHIEKYGLQQYGVCLHFKVLKCFAVQVQQFHSTHTPQNPLRYHPKSRSLHSTHLFGQNLTIPYPNSYPRTTTKTTISTPILTCSHLTTLLHPNPNKSNTNKENIT